MLRLDVDLKQLINDGREATSRSFEDYLKPVQAKSRTHKNSKTYAGGRRILSEQKELDYDSDKMHHEHQRNAKNFITLDFKGVQQNALAYH